jgi:hypothetical protein
MTVLFNPYTGKPRHPSDIESDPDGILILDPDKPVKAFKADILAADSARFEWWFGNTAKSAEFLNVYLTGVREKWSVNVWRKTIDHEMVKK